MGKETGEREGGRRGTRVGRGYPSRYTASRRTTRAEGQRRPTRGAGRAGRSPGATPAKADSLSPDCGRHRPPTSPPPHSPPPCCCRRRHSSTPPSPVVGRLCSPRLRSSPALSPPSSSSSPPSPVASALRASAYLPDQLGHCLQLLLERDRLALQRVVVPAGIGCGIIAPPLFDGIAFYSVN